MGYWADHNEQGQDGQAKAGPQRTYPPAGWPSLGQLTYTKEIVTVLLLVLALPWLVGKLVTDPGSVLAGLGRRAANKSV